MRVSENENRLVQWSLLVLLLIFSISLHAVGPTTTIRIEANDKDPWVVDIHIDEKLKDQLKVEVWLYQMGEILKKREINIDELTFIDDLEERAQYANLSLQTDELNDLPDGVYSQKVIISIDQLEGKSTKPFRVQRWSYLQVERSNIKPLNLEDYSKIADPKVKGIDYFGEETLVYVGEGGKLAVDLRETKLNAALPIGRLGGLQQEQEIKQDQQDKLEGERDED